MEKQVQENIPEHKPPAITKPYINKADKNNVVDANQVINHTNLHNTVQPKRKQTELKKKLYRMKKDTGII